MYLCDGRAGEWFGAPVEDGRLFVRSAQGTVVDARVGDDGVRGSVRPRGQAAGRFTASAPSGPEVGVFAGPDPAAPGLVRRWIVLEDGVRGVSDAPAGDAGAGSGTAAPRPTRSAAPTATASPITITPTPTATPTATPTPRGVSIDASATPTPTITDGTSNTIIIGETTATPTATATRPPGSITDGTSNTIVIGESTATATPTASATRPPGSITDGTSNTIVIGESTATATPSPGSITDGTSNTIVIGETPVNGVAEGEDAPPTTPAPPVTTCPRGTRCPPPAPPQDKRAEGKVSGGSLLSCPALTILIRTLIAPARTDAVARTQLAALTAQAKANGC